MLDMGFIPDIERIAKLVPFTRQTLFFSATMPSEIQGLADKFLQNPARVEVSARASTADTVSPASRRRQFEGLREAGQAARARQGPGRSEERDHLLQPQEGRRRSLPLPGAPRLLGRRPAWRHGPALAHDDAAQFPRRRDPASRRLRCRRARPRHSRCQPCLQLRCADPCGGLCPPHRPHRPCRSLGQGLHARDPARFEIHRCHREADQPQDRLAAGRGDVRPRGERTRRRLRPARAALRPARAAARSPTTGRPTLPSPREPAAKPAEQKPRKSAEKQRAASEAAREAANDDNRSRRGSRRNGDDGHTPVGFGDDIPAFMMIGAKA